jgi:uncharacterized membrane protein YraQ (UPF0718 family)
MMPEERVAYRRRAVFALVITAVLAGYFWSESRVPGLQQKAAMGGRTRLGNLGFEVLFPTGVELSFIERVAQTAIEWGVTNWRGMTFGILFAACVMSVVACFPRRRAESELAGTVKGVLQGLATGVPLGLCANCATPVAQGMYRSGLRPEASLAAVLSSPTLNPIVLGMLFSMFPFGLAVLKVALTLLVVLVGVPLLVSAFPPKVRSAEATAAESHGRWTRWTRLFFKAPPEVVCPLAGAPPEPWGTAALETARSIGRHLVYVLRASLPLMVLAGLVGAVLVELAPLDSLAEASVTPALLLGVAALGTLLPVPMSFDVLAASMLYAAGAPLPIVGTLLFTLGLFSVYPFMVIWRGFRPAIALGLLGVVAALGLAFGLGADALQAHTTRSALSFYADHETKRDVRVFLDSVKAECAASTDDADGCIEAFTRRALATGEDASVCRLLPDAKRWACEEAARFEELTRATKRSGHLAGCADHGTEKDRKQCQTLVVDALTRDNPDVTICAELESAAETAQCKLIVLRSWVEPRGDASLCGGLDDADAQKQCREFAETAMVAKHRSPELCEAFTNPDRAEFCLDRVATILVDEATSRSDNDDGCDTLPENLVESCRRRWAHKWSSALGEPSLCSSLDDEGARRDCVRDATVERLLRDVRRRRSIDAGLLVERAGFPVDPPRVPAAGTTPPRPTEVVQTGPPSIRRTPHDARNLDGDARFVRHKGPDLGLTGLPRYTGFDFREPFLQGRGVASGDFDDDGRPDLAFATRGGPRLYRNLGGLKFAPVPLPESLREVDALAVAFVDLDSDGRLDLFFSAYGADTRAVMNDGGRFDGGRMMSFPNRGAMVALAAGFADTNRDGRLDVYLGNWSFGAEKGFEPTLSQNQLLVSLGEGHVKQILPEAPGETLSVLFTDLNGDRGLDLAVANDYDRPDHFYYGTGDGRFALIGQKSGVFPSTPMHTMSIDSGDIDNDQHADLFMVDMSFGPATPGIYCDPLDGEDAARGRVVTAAFEAYEASDMAACLELPEPAEPLDVQGCMAAVLTQLAFQSRDKDICARLPASAVSMRLLCGRLLDTGVAPPLPVGEWIKQESVNKLLVGDGTGRFIDATKHLGVERSGWTWNARFVDLDDDGFQDIYVGNGYKFLRPTANVFYRNVGRAARFEDQAKQVGLDERLNTPAFSSVDLDGDGDLDLVLTTVPGPVVVYENRLSRGKSVSVELRDELGNRFGVGSKIRIELADAGRTRMMREIRASGGYLSFDAPVAHFGLGDAETVKAIEVEWSTGQAGRYEGPFPAGYTYRIERPLPR